MTRVDDRDDFVYRLEQHAGIVRKIAASYANDPDERRDLMQEIVLQLWRAWPRYEPGRRFSTWMYRIALNVAISHLRVATGPRGAQVSLDELGFEIADPSGASETDDRIAILQQLVAGLPPLDRALLLLHLDDHDYGEIAAILGISPGNVATRLSRIRQRLRRQLEQGNGT